VFVLRRPSPDELARLVDAERTSDLTYREVGATASAGARPAGYRHDRWVADLGSFTTDRFGRAAAALGHWRVHRGAGLIIYPGSPVSVGATFALAFRLAAVYVVAAGRIVYVTSEPDRFGFSYGTLPSHPEQGEEAFHVVRQDSRLLLEIVSFSKPRQPLARLGAPVTRAVQLRVTRRYLTALQQHDGLPEEEDGCPSHRAEP
jgi:uncharacterized protein (UPF0548 family)